MIVLISASPRRRELLSSLTKNVIFDASSVAEPMDEKDPKFLVLKSARLKLEDRKDYHTKGILLACDTLVSTGEVLGKPKDKEDARRMLSNLSGTWHEVHSSLVLLDKETGHYAEDVVTTKVHFSSLSEEQIENYLATGEYTDKAGAYGIQGYGGLLIEGIEGDYFNVMGLPLNRLYHLLLEEFNYDLMKPSS